MSKSIQCPNCGGSHSLANPGVTMLVCTYCQTVVYWDQDAIIKTGAQSILPEEDTRLRIDATGTLHKKPFRVVGRLKYDYGQGHWNEWYLQFDHDIGEEGGGIAWVSEAERELTLETPVAAPANLPAAGQLRAGLAVQLGKHLYSVREVGTATCVGNQGQLPFTVLAGEQYPYADLATFDGQHFATLEYDEAGAQPTVFTGTTLSHADLIIDGEGDLQHARSQAGKNIQCSNCAASLADTESRPADTKTLVCSYCGAQLDLSGAQQQVLGVNPKHKDPGFAFDIGKPAKLQGGTYQVCGRMLYEDDEGYQTREYLLHEPTRGYLWLAEETNHFVLLKPTRQAPDRNPFEGTTRTRVVVGGTDFKLYEQGIVALTYVDGALPWIATVGQRFRYADLIAPPQMFCAESDEQGNDLEYFHGRYFPSKDLQAAFSLSPEQVPPPLGIHPAQPYNENPTTRWLAKFAAVIAIVNLVLLAWSFSQRGKVLLHQSVPAATYKDETLSEPFEIGTSPIMSLTTSAPLNDAWIAVQAALVNERDEVVSDFDSDISYYSGVEDGESWSEGDRKDTVYFKAPPPGRYKLLFVAAGGSSETPTPGQGETMTIELRQGAVLSRYFLILAAIFGVVAIFLGLQRHFFEARRWAPVTESNDDDD